MSDLLNKQICLALNSLWQGMDFRTVKKSFEDITSMNPKTGEPPFLPLDLTYEVNPDGTFNMEILLNARPVSVLEWLSLPVRSCDLGITSARGEIRVPTIIVATNYSKIPDQRPKFSAEAVRKRDNDTCQVSKRKLAPGEGNLAHNIPKCRGGKRSWDNIVYMDRTLNSLQGERTFAEMGWDIKPKAPKGTKVFLTLDDLKHESQVHFLHRN